MRIARLTLDGFYNYGNVLQRLALDIVLRRYGEVDSLWVRPDNFAPREAMTPMRELKNAVKWLINHQGYRDRCRRNFYRWDTVRQARIREFVLRHEHVVDARGRLAELADSYDFFVVGSDQVWNPYYRPNAGMAEDFLTFAPPEKRVSYAASIGLSELPAEFREEYRAWLGAMPHLSLREVAGAQIVAELTGREALVHVDPTLLVEREVYESMERRPVWLTDEPYIVTYLLGDRPAAVDRVARRLGLRVINILDRDIFDHYAVAPEEFLYLIHHAWLMYTDSFHGSVFAIQFRTPLVACDKVLAGEVDGTASRIATLLSTFGLESVHGTVANDFEVAHPLDTDFSSVDAALECERTRSYAYLDAAFGKSC